MKFLTFITALKTLLDLFKPQQPKEETLVSNGKKSKAVLLISLLAAGLALLMGGVLLVRKLKQRRLQKEAEEEAKSFYLTDPDADEYFDESQSSQDQ